MGPRLAEQRLRLVALVLPDREVLLRHPSVELAQLGSRARRGARGPAVADGERSVEAALDRGRRRAARDVPGRAAQEEGSTEPARRASLVIRFLAFPRPIRYGTDEKGLH